MEKRIKVNKTAKRIFRRSWKIWVALWKASFITFRPVFIIGCARSGTTILSNTIGHHPNVKELCERRDLWYVAFPNWDVWTDEVTSPSLQARTETVSILQRIKIRTLFYLLQAVDNASLLLEKWPVNSFRLEAINRLFPEAKFIFIYRNGSEVARSIAKKIQGGNEWYGVNDVKWKSLRDLALKKGVELPLDLSSPTRGIIEWTLSLSYSFDFFRGLETERFICFSYDQLIDDSENVLECILEFLSLESSKLPIERLARNLTRRTPQGGDHYESAKFVSTQDSLANIPNVLRKHGYQMLLR